LRHSKRAGDLLPVRREVARSNERGVMMFPKPKRKKRKRPEFNSPPATECMVCGLQANYVQIEKHHIKPKGMGGTWDPKSADPENEIHLCAGPGSNYCHYKAHQYMEGYRPDDLRRIKAEYMARRGTVENSCKSS
jgi:hypothetical protein